jgi:hypothetical protein
MNATCIGLVNPSEIIGTHTLGTIATGKWGRNKRRKWKRGEGTKFMLEEMTCVKEIGHRGDRQC